MVKGSTLVTSTQTLISNFFPIIINGRSIYFWATHIVSDETKIDFTGLPAGRYVSKSAKGLQNIVVAGDGRLSLGVELGSHPTETVELQIKR